MADEPDIYALREDSSPRSPRRSRRPILPPGARLGRGQWIAWLLAALVVGGVGLLAFHDGIHLRKQIWQSSRSIRFPGDINFGYQNGTEVLHLARIVQAEEKDTRPEPTIRQLGVAMTRMYRGTIANAPDGDFRLDYPPIRLFIMALWARHVDRTAPDQINTSPFSRGYPNTTDPQPEDIAEPMLMFNTACAAASAIAMFLLVWVWVRRTAPPVSVTSALRFFLALGGLVLAILGFRYAVPKSMPPLTGAAWPGMQLILALAALAAAMVMCARRMPNPHRAWACGLVAALLVWFDPITLLNAHAWPQWDVWILPVFLFATLLASLDWWVTAGVIMGVGCMAKGQLFLAGPILLFWPLFGGRWGAAIRIASGWALGSAAVVWPWIIRSDAAITWLQMVTLTAFLAMAASLLRAPLMRKRKILPEAAQMRVGLSKPRPKWPWFIAAAAAAIIVIAASYVLIFTHMPKTADMGKQTLCLMLIVLIPPWFLPRRSLGFWLAAVLAISVWITALAFDGNFDWLTLGFVYGSHKQDKMQMGDGSFTNLVTLLSVHYGWSMHDIVGTLNLDITRLHIKWSYDLELKSLLAILYGATLLIASAAAAAQSRRNDPKFLVAIVVPWLLFPILMCQMSERYLLWASAISAAMVAVSTGLTLLHLAITALAAGMILHHMMMSADQQDWWPGAYDFFTRWYPDGAWAMLLLAAIFLAASLAHGRAYRASLEDE